MSIITYLSSHESGVSSESVSSVRLTPDEKSSQSSTQVSAQSSTQVAAQSSTHPSTQSSAHVSIEEAVQPSQEEANQNMILKHIDGYASTGEMTAILGARSNCIMPFITSGAGKTTLLSILCGRNSNFTGQFSINGREVSASSLRSIHLFQITYRKVCRFVRQHDLFYEFLTVQEHLYYQAILRLGDQAERQIRDRLVWVRCLGSVSFSL